MEVWLSSDDAIRVKRPHENIRSLWQSKSHLILVVGNVFCVEALIQSRFSAVLLTPVDVSISRSLSILGNSLKGKDDRESVSEPIK